MKKLIKTIVEVKEKVPSPHYLPKCIDSIQKAAEGILFNIKGSSVIGLRALFLVARSNSINSNSHSGYSKFTGPNLMISYAEGDNDICTQLYNELAKRNIQFDVCIDWKYCNIDFPWEHIDRGMDNPNVILCLLSQNTMKAICVNESLSKSFVEQMLYQYASITRKYLGGYVEVCFITV